MKHILKILIGLGLTFFVSMSMASSQAKADSHRPFYPMDLSILLKNPQEAPTLLWELFSADTRTQILEALRSAWNESEIDFPTAAVLAGLRVDPCGADHFSANKQLCRPQLRLIGENLSSEDRSLHLIFELSETQLLNLSRSLQKLNDRCPSLQPDMPLQVHPCTAESAYLRDLVNLLKKYAQEINLGKVAFQTRVDDSPQATQWIFGAAVKSASRGWIALKFPWARQGREIFSFGRGEGVLLPIQRDGVDFMIKEGLEGGLNERQVTALVNNLEDTKLRTVKNTSCFSCHATQALRSQFGSLTESNPDYFFISQKERDASLNVGRTDIRHFGYRFGEPKISTRTKIETLESVEQMNLLHPSQR